MANSFFSDLKKSSSDATLGITDDLLSIKEGFKNLSATSSKFNKELLAATSNIDKFKISFTSAFAKSGALVTLGLSFVSLGTNVATVTSLIQELQSSLKNFKGVSQGLSFAEAIAGSKQLENNLKFISETGNQFSKLSVIVKSAFDPASAAAYSSASVKAFANVEQAAYRLSTITVSGSDRSITALNKNIEGMRRLQKETNFAIDSVSLLNTQYDIASAGFTSQRDQEQVGSASINLSQAGFGNVAGSTNAVVKVLRALDESAGDAEKRAAQLFETTKVGLVTLDQLTSEVGILSVQSKQLGISFEESAAALAGLTTKGVSAAEGNTKLVAFFNEVVAGSEQANKVLANFRDKAGKPIQINAANLREKGIKGVVEDLKTATGGDVSVLQQIFSSKEAQEAAQLLISLGDTFEDFTGRIKGVDTGAFAEESANRAKTLSGAYNKAFNESQKYVEDFGKGVSENALESLGAVGEIASKSANAGAEGFGKLTGSIVGISTKIQAVGGFLLSAFTIVAPIVLFQTLFKKAQELIQKFKDFRKEGESPWDTIKRAGLLAIESIKANFITGIRSIIGEIFGIEEAFEQVAKKQQAKKEQAAKQTKQLEGRTNALPEAQQPTRLALPPGQRGGELAVRSRPDPSLAIRDKAPRDNLAVRSSPRGDVLDIRATTVSTTQAIGQSTKFDRSAGVLGRGLDNLKASFGSLAKGGLGQLGGFIGNTAGKLGLLGLGATAASAAFEIATGWLDTFGKIGNKSTIPALQDLRESLLDVKNVEGISKLVSALDPVTATVNESNIIVGTFNETLSELGRYWNEATGKATQYRIAAEEINNAVSILNTEIESDLQKASEGKTGAKSTAARNAENKISLGIELNSDDRTALDAEINNSIAKINARVAALRNKAKAAQGNVNEEEQTKLNQEAKDAEAGKEAQIKSLRNLSSKRELDELVNKFNNTDTSISLAADIRIENRSSFKAQIDSIATDLNDAIAGKLSDPEKFKVLKNNIESAFKGLEVTAAIDPEEAIKQRDQLIATLGEDNFNKLLKNNPSARLQAISSNTAITGAANKNEQNKLTSRNSILDTADSLGSSSGLLGFEKSNNTVKSLNAQVANLNKELQRPETTLARQAEILAEISQLEAQRVSAKVEGQIKLELSGKKQQLTITEQLVSIEQSKVNLYSQENKFNSLSITQAQAKLDASNKELALKKAQLEITSREEVIKKQAIITSLQASKVAKDSSPASTSSSFSNVKPAISSVSENAGLSKIKENAEKAKAAAKQDLENKLKESSTSAVTFTAADRKLISQSIAKSIASDSSTGSFIDENLGEGTTKSFNNRRGRRSNAIINPEKIEARLFDEAGKSTIDPKKLQSQLSGSLSVLDDGFNKLFEQNLAVDQAGKLKSNSKAGVQKAYDETVKAIEDKLAKDLDKQQQKIAENKTLGGTGGKLGTTGVNRKVISEAQQDLANTQVKNNLAKVGLEYETAVKNITLTLDKEFAIREKSLKNSELIADSFTKLASNSEVFGDSVVSASLQLSAFKIADNNKRIDIDAERAKKDIDARIKVDETNISELNKSLAEAYKKGASQKVIDSIQTDIDSRTKTLNTARNERIGDRKTIDLQSNLAKANNVTEEDAINLRLNSRNRELNRSSSTEVSSAFSGLASTLGSTLSKILPNNRVSEDIATTDAIQKALTARETRSITRSNTTDQLNARIEATSRSLEAAQKSGAGSDVLNRLSQARDIAIQEAGVNTQRLAQQQSLEEANDKLNVFATLLDTNNSKIAETVDIMNKQVSVIKDTLDLQQRQNDLSSETNKSNTGLQSSLFGFLGKNNPLTSILQQRLDVNQNNDEAIAQKAKNVNDAKKDLLDNTVQKAQLDLEQQGYENALTQTALLADILSVSQGNSPELSGDGFIQDSLSKLSENFGRTRELNANRINLLDRKQTFIESELAAKNLNVDKDTTAKNLSALGSDLRPANFDLIAKSVNDTQSLLKNSSREKINIGSLEDPEFKAQLKNLNNLTANTREAIATSTRATKPSNNSQGTNSPKVNISAPVSLNINVSGDTGGANYDSNLRDYVGKSVNSGLSKLTRELEQRLR